MGEIDRHLSFGRRFSFNRNWYHENALRDALAGRRRSSHQA
jgi:hypothetical protein